MRKIAVLVFALSILRGTSAADARFLQTDPVGYGPDMNLYTYSQNDPTDRVDPTGRVDDVTGGNWQVQQQLNNPTAQRAQIVIFAIGAPLIPAAGIAGTVGSPAIASIAVGGGVGGSVSAITSALQGNSNAQVLSDSGKGVVNAVGTNIAGRIGGVSGPVGVVSGEITGAYITAKGTGSSDTQATVSAVAAGIVGVFTMPAGTQVSAQFSGIAATAMRNAIKGTAKAEIKSACPKTKCS